VSRQIDGSFSESGEVFTFLDPTLKKMFGAITAFTLFVTPGPYHYCPSSVGPSLLAAEVNSFDRHNAEKSPVCELCPSVFRCSFSASRLFQCLAFRSSFPHDADNTWLLRRVWRKRIGITEGRIEVSPFPMTWFESPSAQFLVSIDSVHDPALFCLRPLSMIFFSFAPTAFSDAPSTAVFVLSMM
jgi:hypothetical protein